MAVWKLELLGSPHLVGKGKRLPLERKIAGVLTLVTIENTVSRTRLCELFWSNLDSSAARNNLRGLLHKLRDFEGLLEGTEVLKLGSDVEVDALELSRLHFESSSILLEGVEYADCEVFNEWLLFERERLVQIRLEALAASMAKLERQGDVLAALSLARARLQADPISEIAHRDLIRLLYLNGDRAAAMLAFERCREMLQIELGLAPLPETLLLIAEIERGQLPTASRSGLPVGLARPSILVGRETELEQLSNAVQAGVSVIVSGEPGIGKTRFVSDFANSQGASLLIQGRPGDSSIPYSSLARGIKTWFESRDAGDIPDSVRAVLARFVPSLGAVQTINDKQQFLETLNAFRVWLKVPSLVLDDLQFMDTASLEAVIFFLNNPTKHSNPLLTHRSNELEPQLAQTLRESVLAGLAVSIVLQPLTLENVGSLLTNLEPSLQPLAAALQQRTGGNPLFVVETLKHLFETGQLETGLFEPLPSPSRASGLLEARLERLSQPTLQLAQLIAVALEDYSSELASRVLAKTAFEVLESEVELERAQMFAKRRFSHDLLLETVRATTPQAVGLFLHAQVAQALQEQTGNAPQIARHWLEAHQEAKAAPWLMLAASQAQSTLELTRAQELFDQAAVIFNAHGQANQAFDCLDQSLKLRLQSALSPDLLEPINALFKRAKTSQQYARVLSLRAHLFHLLGQDQDCVKDAREGIDLHLKDLSLTVAFRNFLGLSLWKLGQLQAALLEFETVLSQELEPVTLAETLCNKGILLDTLGRNLESIAVHQQALALCEQLADTQAQLSVLGNLSIAQAELGWLQQSKRTLERIRVLLNQTNGTNLRWMYFLISYGSCHRDLSEYTQALECYDEVLTRSLGTSFWGTGAVRAFRANVLLALGALEQAHSELEEVAQDPNVWLDVVLMTRCKIAHARGDREGLHRSLLELEIYMQHEEQPKIQVANHLLRANLLEPPVALEHAKMALDLVNQKNLTGLKIAAFSTLANSYLQLEQPELALEFSQKAMTCLTEANPLGIELRQVLLVHAQILLKLNDTSTREYLGQALEQLQTSLQKHVPEMYRKSFLERNPTNVRLLELAGQTNLELGFLKVLVT